MLKAYREGADLHALTAASVLGSPSDEITSELRQKAKAVSFGLLFGQGATGLARYARAEYGVDMTDEEAEAARQSFFNTYPGLRNWQRKTLNIVQANGKTTMTPGGRIRDLSKESNWYTEALNTPIQGAEAEIMQEALASLNGIENSLVNLIHDELVFEVDETEVPSSPVVALGST